MVRTQMFRLYWQLWTSTRITIIAMPDLYVTGYVYWLAREYLDISLTKWRLEGQDLNYQILPIIIVVPDTSVFDLLQCVSIVM